MRRDIDGLTKDIMLLEGRLQRSLAKKAQYIYANLQDKFGRQEKKDDEEGKGGGGLAESILAMQGVKRNEKMIISMGKRIKELETRDKKREGAIKELLLGLEELQDAIQDVLVVEKHKTVKQLRADVDALQRKVKVRSLTLTEYIATWTSAGHPRCVLPSHQVLTLFSGTLCTFLDGRTVLLSKPRRIMYWRCTSYPRLQFMDDERRAAQAAQRGCLPF